MFSCWRERVSMGQIIAARGPAVARGEDESLTAGLPAPQETARIAVQSGSMFASVMPATLIRPDPTM